MTREVIQYTISDNREVVHFVVSVTNEAGEQDYVYDLQAQLITLMAFAVDNNAIEWYDPTLIGLFVNSLPFPPKSI